MDTPATIVRILAVRDTRQSEEIGDRFVKIPGSGNIRSCDRCGKDHEIHVDVELSNGKTAVIGQGCAKTESLDVQARIKSAVSGAKTHARLAAELAAARKALASAESAWDAAQALALPGEPTIAEERPGSGGITRIWELGDASVWCMNGRPFDEERRRSLVESWRNNRYRQAGQSRDPWMHRNDVCDLEQRLDRAARKLQILIASDGK